MENSDYNLHSHFSSDQFSKLRSKSQFWQIEKQVVSWFFTSESELSSSANVGALRSLLRCTVTCVAPFCFPWGAGPPFATEASADFLPASGVGTSTKRNRTIGVCTWNAFCLLKSYCQGNTHKRKKEILWQLYLCNYFTFSDSLLRQLQAMACSTEAVWKNESSAKSSIA